MNAVIKPEGKNQKFLRATIFKLVSQLSTREELRNGETKHDTAWSYAHSLDASRAARRAGNACKVLVPSTIVDRGPLGCPCPSIKFCSFRRPSPPPLELTTKLFARHRTTYRLRKILFLTLQVHNLSS